jgi:DNA-binding transcriptional ArsR family regulator
VDVFTVIADPSRRRILDLLAAGDQSAGRLVDEFPSLTQPAVSRHLRVLREAGLVSVRGDGQRRLYRLEPRGLAELDAWLARYRGFWADALDAHVLDGRSSDHPERTKQEEAS